MTPSEALRDLADAMESPGWGRPTPPPTNFIPIGQPRPPLKGDECYWRWHAHTGEITIHIVDGQVVRIDRPTRVIGVVPGPRSKEIAADA